MNFEIIDFHTHPFIEEKHNIASHRAFCNMGPEDTWQVFKTLGISKICGSVIDCRSGDNSWARIKSCNDTALKLREMYGDFYVPGFHIHPGYIQESIDEMRRMKLAGVKLIGELVPYIDGWDDYSSDAFSTLLDEADKNNMVVSFHSQGEDEMDAMVKKHKSTVFVAAHPGEYREFMRHLERFKMSENYYLDLSGTGIFRYGVLRRAIDTVGADRLLFGTDFPTCNPSCYLGGLLLDPLLTDSEREKIFSLNAKKLLNLK